MTFSTLGYGYIVPAHAWRVLGGARGCERVPAHRLVDRLSDRGRHPHRPVQAGEHF
ncbi:hypothetical protein NKL58_29795 [Mesorhizobium australicum]|nr:hypothetical protein [Mesorhizobium sp. LNHC209A00]